MLGLTPSKNFTTKSLYKLLTDGGVSSRLARKLWKCNIPLKIKVFLWQAFQNRLQTGQLKERLEE
jgi:S-adenosylmethionine:diacylglycerol 3-amino-3-carboxypropyl transferase